MRRSWLLVGMVLLAWGQQARADLQVAGVFGNHMVLQQGMAVPVWGTADPGEKVTVKFRGQEVEGTADDKGMWRVSLQSMKAQSKQKGTPLIVAGKTKTVTFADVLVGEVWLCSGQSNMQWGLGGSNAADDIAAAKLPAIRHRYSGGGWVVCSPQTAAGFTGVGFYFARKVHQETGLPIGLLNNSIGGTRIEPWLAPGSQESEPGLKPVLEQEAAQVVQYGKQVAAQLDKIEAWVKASRQALADNKIPPAAPPIPAYPTSQFSQLYRPFTEPLRPYAIRGMLWYQGESNGNEGDIYFHKKRALIEGMRKAWGQGDFPAYFVQLPQIGGVNNNPTGGDGWARIRQCR